MNHIDLENMETVVVVMKDLEDHLIETEMIEEISTVEEIETTEEVLIEEILEEVLETVPEMIEEVIEMIEVEEDLRREEEAHSQTNIKIESHNKKKKMNQLLIQIFLLHCPMRIELRDDNCNISQCELVVANYSFILN